MMKKKNIFIGCDHKRDLESSDVELRGICYTVLFLFSILVLLPGAIVYLLW
ncbi:MAG TPA: hypothetical protein VF490_06200 [Chryseosolibacter sp.]